MRYLLVIDTARNVVLVDVVNDIRMPIGAPLPPDQKSHVTTAVWSPLGRWTAWSVGSTEIDGIREVRLHDEDSDQADVLVPLVEAFYLCPSPCGRWLSHLSPGPLGLELALSDVATGAIHVVERGQPLFWSWSPDANQLAVHVENRVLIADSDGGATRLLTDGAGSFVAPWWLPGGSVLYGLEDRIVAAGPDNTVTTLVDRGSAGRFSLDPEGRLLAYVADTNSGASLMVLDLISHEQVEVTSIPVAGFFWSPTSSRLAVLTATADGLVQWTVFDGAITHQLRPFRPGRSWAGSVLPFFEQYAQSHSPWSTDSNALVAPAIDENDQAGALIQKIDSPIGDQWILNAELAWWA